MIVSSENYTEEREKTVKQHWLMVFRPDTGFLNLKLDWVEFFIVCDGLINNKRAGNWNWFCHGGNLFFWFDCALMKSIKIPPIIPKGTMK